MRCWRSSPTRWLARSLAFRGGTALYKLYLTPAARYSEDIHLIQVEAGPAGAVMDAIRATLDPWLDEPRWKQAHGRVTFRYDFESGGAPPIKLRLKVEINTREHVAVLGHANRSFSVQSPWFARTTNIRTFELDELLATKLHALYQRKKGRDLFHLAEALRDTRSDPARIVRTFRAVHGTSADGSVATDGGCSMDGRRGWDAGGAVAERQRGSGPATGRYMDAERHPVTRAMFERNLDGKLRDPSFGSDMSGLLAAGREWHMLAAAQSVTDKLLARLPGEEWQGRKLGDLGT